jgi:hypothetical protein
MTCTHNGDSSLEAIKQTVTINPVATTASRLMAIQPKSLSPGVPSKTTGVNSETIRHYEKSE